MSRRDLRARPAWQVRIPAHTIERATINGRQVPMRGPAYEIPEAVTIRFEDTAESSIRLAVFEAHVAARVPAWLPYVRESIALARAERVTWRPEGVAAG